MRLEAFVIEMPLRQHYAASGHHVTNRRGIIVRASEGDLVGWGEFVEVPGYSPETVETAIAAMSGMPVTHVNPGAVAAVRTAELVLEAKRQQQPLTVLLGASPGPVEAGAVVARVGDLAGVVTETGRRLDEGYQKIKVKIGPGFDVEPLNAVRQEHPESVIAADANGAYEPDELPDVLDDLGLLYLEQPYAATQPWSAFAALRARFSTRIALDESITGQPSLRSAIAAGACDVVTLKAARVAGLRQAVEMHDTAVAAGLTLVAGGLLETGVGRGAAAALARLPGFTLPADLSASDRYWDRDLTQPWRLEAGALVVPDRPGLGVEVDGERLGQVTLAHHELDGG